MVIYVKHTTSWGKYKWHIFHHGKSEPWAVYLNEPPPNIYITEVVEICHYITGNSDQFLELVLHLDGDLLIKFSHTTLFNGVVHCVSFALEFCLKWTPCSNSVLDSPSLQRSALSEQLTVGQCCDFLSFNKHNQSWIRFKLFAQIALEKLISVQVIDFAPPKKSMPVRANLKAI